MSGKATGWALEQRLAPTTKLVLVALADECRRDGTTCFPSRKRIAECVGIQPRALSRHLATLEELRLISREERYRENGSRTSTLYRLTIDGPLAHLDKAPPVTSDKGPLHEPGQGPPCLSVQGHVVEPSQKEPEDEPTPTAPTRLPSVDRQRVTADEYRLAGIILEVFNGAAGTGFTLAAHLTPVVCRIREHPELDEADHRRIIAAAFGRPWWKGPPGPEVVYGNAAQFERSSEQAKAPVDAAARVSEGARLMQERIDARRQEVGV